MTVGDVGLEPELQVGPRGLSVGFPGVDIARLCCKTARPVGGVLDTLAFEAHGSDVSVEFSSTANGAVLKTVYKIRVKCLTLDGDTAECEVSSKYPELTLGGTRDDDMMVFGVVGHNRHVAVVQPSGRLSGFRKGDTDYGASRDKEVWVRIDRVWYALGLDKDYAVHAAGLSVDEVARATDILARRRKKGAKFTGTVTVN